MISEAQFAIRRNRWTSASCNTKTFPAIVFSRVRRPTTASATPPLPPIVRRNRHLLRPHLRPFRLVSTLSCMNSFDDDDDIVGLQSSFDLWSMYGIERWLRVVWQCMSSSKSVYLLSKWHSQANTLSCMFFLFAVPKTTCTLIVSKNCRLLHLAIRFRVVQNVPMTKSPVNNASGAETVAMPSALFVVAKLALVILNDALQNL